jgi:hypothetical protein
VTDEHRYDVEVLHLLVSPAHAYFGRARDGAADVPTVDADRVEVLAGKGAVGDRFYGKAAHLDAAVTLLAVEALEAVARDLGHEQPFDPLLARRNVVLRGAQLAPLQGHDFALESRVQLLRLRGTRPTPARGWTSCSRQAPTPPCGAGAGSAAPPLTDAVLHRGPAVLVSPFPLDPTRAGEAVLRRTRLP